MVKWFARLTYKNLMKCYKPNFFENQSERLAITKPANTCNEPQKEQDLSGFRQ